MQLVAYGAEGVYLTDNPQVTSWNVTYRRNNERFKKLWKQNLEDTSDVEKTVMKKVYLAKNVDPRIIARGTPGFSGADLANLLVGSQIKGAKITGALPVSIITSENIEGLGIESGEEIIQSIDENGSNNFNMDRNIRKDWNFQDESLLLWNKFRIKPENFNLAGGTLIKKDLKGELSLVFVEIKDEEAVYYYKSHKV